MAWRWRMSRERREPWLCCRLSQNTPKRFGHWGANLGSSTRKRLLRASSREEGHRPGGGHARLDVGTDNVGLHPKKTYEDGEPIREGSIEKSSVDPSIKEAIFRTTRV